MTFFSTSEDDYFVTKLLHSSNSTKGSTLIVIYENRITLFCYERTSLQCSPVNISDLKGMVNTIIDIPCKSEVDV